MALDFYGTVQTLNDRLDTERPVTQHLATLHEISKAKPIQIAKGQLAQVWARGAVSLTTSISLYSPLAFLSIPVPFSLVSLSLSLSLS
jgi:hypothetical protein